MKNRLILTIIAIVGLFGIVFLARGIAWMVSGSPEQEIITSMPIEGPVVTLDFVKPVATSMNDETDDKKGKIIAQLKKQIRIKDGKIIGGFKNGSSFSIKESYQFNK